MHRSPLLAMAALLALAAATTADDQPVKVRARWQPGQYAMTMNLQSEGEMTIAGNKGRVKDDTTWLWQIDVGKPNDKDEKKMVLRLSAARTDGEQGGEAYHFDSAKPDGEKGEQAFVYKPLMAADVVVMLDADDTVLEVSGLDKLWASLADKAQTAARKLVLAEMKVSLCDKAFELNLRRLEGLMPKEAVAAGSQWKSGFRLDLPMVGELKARCDCKLVGIDKSDSGEIATIDARSSYSLSGPRSSQIEGVAFTVNKLDMEETAALKVNLKTGLIVLDESKRVATMQAKATEGGKDAEVASTVTTRGKVSFRPAGQAPAALPAATQPGDRAADKPAAAGKKPVTVVLRRQWEPKQKAFSVLVPAGWTVEGGLFSVDPTQAGGALNSIDTKCDFAIKRDAAGSVMLRWAPSYNFVDFSRNAEFNNLAAIFTPGKAYNGALVKAMPAVEEFLMEGFKLVRPNAAAARITQRIAVPEVEEALKTLMKDVNAKAAQIGKQPMTFSAGAIVLEYTEAGVGYREAAFTALSDWRAAAALWSNVFTFHMRAPAAEADAWKPVADIIRQSLKISPEWLAEYQKAAAGRGAEAVEVFKYLARVDQDIFERRSKVRSDIQHENYLLLTGQEEYVNPFTREVERDSSDYSYRWANASGDRLYTDEHGFDPNKDENLRQQEWKLTPVRPRQ